MQSKSTIFILYAFEDESFLLQLQLQLNPFENRNEIVLLHTGKIVVGTSKKDFMQQSMEQADIVVPLLSPHFLGQKENVQLLAMAVEKHQNGTAQLIPILIRPCMWEYSKIKDLQILPKSETPVIEHPHQDSIFNEVALELIELLPSRRKSSFQNADVPAVIIQYEHILKELVFFPFPFSLTFISQLLGAKNWQNLSNHRDLFQDKDDLLWQISEKWRTTLEKESQITPTQIKILAQKCLAIYHSQSLSPIDLKNVLYVLSSYLENYTDKRATETLIEIFQSINILQIQNRQAITPILEKLSLLLEQLELTSAVIAACYHKIADDYCKLSYELDKALIFGEKALKFTLELKGADSLEVAACMETLANIYLFKGDFKQAIELFQKSLAIKGKLLSNLDFDLAVLYWRMANPYIRLNLLEEAELYLGNALEICSHQAVTPQRERFLAAVYSNLVMLYQNKGDFESALDACYNATTLKETIYGIDHPQTAINYNHLADIYYLKGKPKQAITFYKKAKKIRMDSLGANHPDTIATISNLATSYRATKMYAKAKVLFDQVIDYLEKEFHPEAFIYYAEIGKYYLALKEYEKGKHFFDLSIEHAQSQFGEDNADTAHYLHDIGLIYQKQGELLTALELFETALDLKKTLLEQGHPYIADTLFKIGEIKIHLSAFTEALEYFEQALSIRKQKFGIDNTYTGEAVNQIARTFYLQQNLEKSIDYYEQALGIYRKLMDSTMQAITYANLINCRIQAEKLDSSNFVNHVSALMHLLKIHESSVQDKVIAFFKEEKTFNEELAKRIWEMVSCKNDFKAFMQKFQLLLPPKDESHKEEKFTIPTKKISANQSARIKSLMAKIRKKN